MTNPVRSVEIRPDTRTELNDSCNCLCCFRVFRRGANSPAKPMPCANAAVNQKVDGIVQEALDRARDVFERSEQK